MTLETDLIRFDEGEVNRNNLSEECAYPAALVIGTAYQFRRAQLAARDYALTDESKTADDGHIWTAEDIASR